MSNVKTLVDTHCHLNFKIFEKNFDRIIGEAKKTGVDYIIVPGTDITSSRRAVEIAEKYEGVYAAVGIHPHHLFGSSGACLGFIPVSARLEQYPSTPRCLPAGRQVRDPFSSTPALKKTSILGDLINLLKNKKVVAIGEVGLDKHIYKKTKHQDYSVDNDFIKLQKELLKQQIKLALNYDKSLILHNREAKDDFLQLLNENWDKKLESRTVFHCCEADSELLKFATDRKIYLGVDGDITYDKNKQEFMKKIPLDLLVFETDAPFLTPRLSSFRSGTGRQARPLKYPNEPKNILLIAEFIAKLLNISINRLIEITTKNAKRLFLI